MPKQLGYRLYADIKPLLHKHERWRQTAKLLGLSRTALNRLEWFIYHDQHNSKNVARTARHFGIHRDTFYHWQKRFDESNLRTLEDQSKSPKKRRTSALTRLQTERIVKLRKDRLCYGKMKLKTLYEQEYTEFISSWHIQQVIEDYSLYPPPRRSRERRKRLKGAKKKRITDLLKQPHPGFLICLDTIVLYRWNLKRYIITGIDWNGKLAYARMYTNHSSKTAEDFLRRLHYLLGSKIENLLHDNGSEFEKYFATAAAELKLDRYYSRVKTPKDNPVCERFNRTLKEEFLRFGNFRSDPAIFNRNLTDWLIEYNFRRPHQSLNYLTPIQVALNSGYLSEMSPSSTAA
jgi:transposase